MSEPTYEGSIVTGNGTSLSVPGSTYMSIRKREASTSVELPSGGSIVIAGLVQDNVRQGMSGLPGISKVPVFGTLFRSKDFIRNESELVIIATPYLVRPVHAMNWRGRMTTSTPPTTARCTSSTGSTSSTGARTMPIPASTTAPLALFTSERP